mgnify:CR=1 FL=1
MVNLNKVLLAGNLTRDPEIRYSQAGKAVADLNMAINRRYKLASGEFKEDACFVNVVAWDHHIGGWTPIIVGSASRTSGPPRSASPAYANTSHSSL